MNMQSRDTADKTIELHSRHQPAQLASGNAHFDDPMVQIPLRGDAQTVSEAEGKLLDANIRQVIELVESPLTDEEFRAHPLI